MWNGGLGRQQGTAHIDRKERVDVFDGEISDQAVACNAGVVYENVQATERADRLVDRALDRSRIGVVGLDCDTLLAELLD